MSNAIESFLQVNLYLEFNNLKSNYQSAFCCSRSTETALLKVFNDFLCYLDKSLSVMRVGLDLSAAFGIIDNQFFFEILVKSIGLQSVVLLFIKNSFESGARSNDKWMSFC